MGRAQQPVERSRDNKNGKNGTSLVVELHVKVLFLNRGFQAPSYWADSGGKRSGGMRYVSAQYESHFEEKGKLYHQYPSHRDGQGRDPSPEFVFFFIAILEANVSPRKFGSMDKIGRTDLMVMYVYKIVHR